MMGLTPRARPRSRLDAVLEFAELEEFVDLKLKNYSSGMLVRLAFSVMIQSDAEILLIDEVLAVGDAAFQQKCADVFHEIATPTARSSSSPTTWARSSSTATGRCCSTTATCRRSATRTRSRQRYLRLNFRARAPSARRRRRRRGLAEMLLLDAWLEDATASAPTTSSRAASSRFHAIFEAPTEIPGPASASCFANADGVEVGGFDVGMSTPATERRTCSPPASACTSRPSSRTASPPGRYVDAVLGLSQPQLAKLACHAPHVLDFVVFGTDAPAWSRSSTTSRSTLDGERDVERRGRP